MQTESSPGVLGFRPTGTGWGMWGEAGPSSHRVRLSCPAARLADGELGPVGVYSHAQPGLGVKQVRNGTSCVPGLSNHRSLSKPLWSWPCGRSQLTPLLFIGQGVPGCPLGWHWANSQGVRVRKRSPQPLELTVRERGDLRGADTSPG